MRASYVHTHTYTHSHVAKNDGVGGDVNGLERINIATVFPRKRAGKTFLLSAYSVSL